MSQVSDATSVGSAVVQSAVDEIVTEWMTGIRRIGNTRACERKINVVKVMLRHCLDDADAIEIGIDILGKLDALGDNRGSKTEVLLRTLKRLDDHKAAERGDAPLEALPPMSGGAVDTGANSAHHAVAGSIIKSTTASVQSAFDKPTITQASNRGLPAPQRAPDTSGECQRGLLPSTPKTEGNSNCGGQNDTKPVAFPVAEGWAARHPTASLDILRQNAWHTLEGKTISFTSKNRYQTYLLTGKDATKITNAFFGKKWVGGCVERIIDIVRGRETVDVTITSGQAAERDDIPEELRNLLRSLRNVKASETSEATNSLRAYLALVVFGDFWEEVRQILGPNGDPIKRQELLALCFDDGDHSRKSWAVCITATKNLVCDLAGSGFDVNSFNKTKEYTHLPMAIVRHFGTGGLMYLPSARDPFRQLWDMRTALDPIMGLIELSGHGNGDWLGHLAELMRVEIVDRIADGELLAWPDDVLNKIKARGISITEAVQHLRESRSSGDASMVDARVSSQNETRESDDPMEEPDDIPH